MLRRTFIFLSSLSLLAAPVSAAQDPIADLLVAQQLPDTPDCFAFTDALEEGYENDPRIAGAKASREQATANLMAAQSQTLPQISMFAQSTDGDQGLLNNRSDRDQAGLQITQNLYNFGANKLAQAGAKADVIAARHDLTQASADAAEEAGSAYLELLRSNEILKLAEDQEAYYEADVNSVDERLSAKAITIADASQVKASYALAVNQRIEAILGRDSARRRLEILIDQPVTCTSRQSAIAFFEATESVLGEETLDSLIGYALDNASGIRSAEARLKAANLFTEEVRRRAMPNVSLSGFVAYDRQIDPNTNTEEWSDLSRVSVNVSGQLYTGGLNRARGVDANARLRTARSDLQLNRRILEDTVSRAWVQSQAQIPALQAVADARKNLKTQLENVEAEYKIGSRTVTDLVQAADAYYSAASQEINLKYQYYNNLLVLRSAAFGLAADSPF